MADTLLYCYAVTDATASPEGLRGLEDKPVWVLTIDGLRVAVSEHQGLSLTTEPAQLARCAAVADALLEHGAVVPMRFGTLLARPSLERRVRDAREALRADLERVRGKVELGLRIRGPQEDDEDDETDPPPPAAGAAEGHSPGRDYLERRRRAQQETARIPSAARRLHETLDEQAAQSRLWVRPSAGVVLTAAYLVSTDRVAEMAAVVDAMVRADEHLAISLTGPWAPYSFVTGGSDGPD